MQEKPQILAIDDDPEYCKLIAEVLAEDFECFTALSGKEGLALFEERCKPIVVLVDLSLPDLDGFKICSKLSEYRDERDFALFIVSGEDSTETKIKAFEHGADDYISKPFELSELVMRIKRSIAYVEMRLKLQEERTSTQGLAHLAMAQASQYSLVMNFFKQLTTCRNYQDVAKLFFDTMRSFDLHASLMLSGEEVIFYDQDLVGISPIEQNIYEVLRDKGRIYEFGQRMMINGRNVSFLIKNMPQDANKAGEARDFLAAMVEGMESKLSDIDVQNGMVSAVTELNTMIGSLKEGIQAQSHVLSSVLGEMVSDISASYHALDLTEEQETFFTDLVEKGAARMNIAENLLLGLQTNLEDLKESMESIQKEASSLPPQSDVGSDDVELF